MYLCTKKKPWREEALNQGYQGTVNAANIGKEDLCRPLCPHKADHPWETVAVDLMALYPSSPTGKTNLLDVTDMFSHWTEAFPMGNAETLGIVGTVEAEVFSGWGYPSRILSDNGRQFSSTLWKEACARWGAKHWTTAMYHPRANSTEKQNQEIKKGLRLTLENRHQDLDKQDPAILFLMRQGKYAATQHSPSEVLLGRNL